MVRKIGQGGMGEVYLADDTKLDRKVALKFLPSIFSANESLISRFAREAKAVAKINHPNVVTIYEVGEYKGRPFFAMEFVEGQTLREIAKEGNRSISWIIDIAIQICQGLGEAHRARIIHRDIKTSNILVDQSSRVRILDFGLADMVDKEPLTKTGSTLGTASYMSPEQISGRDVDHRSDLFSMGIVLYELISGRNPFWRDNDGATLNAIMEDTPTSISQTRNDVPEPLSRCITKLLEKDIELRYQSTAGVLADLKKMLYDSHQPISSTDSLTSGDKSILVIPFQNMSSDPDNEYFSDGLTEEIIADLSGIQEIRVLSRSTSMRFKGTDRAIRSIGQELGIRYILTGSVRKAGNNVRITAQLVEAASDRQVWAEKFRGTLDDIFEIQENVSKAIVETLKVQLTDKEQQNLNAHPITDTRAYEYYLRALALMDEWNRFDNYQQAEKYLIAALKIEGDNATLFAGLAYIYCVNANYGHSWLEYFEKSKEYADKALTLDPNNAKALMVQGLFYGAFGGKQKEALESLKMALEISPNDISILGWLGVHYCIVGRTDKLKDILDKIEFIDPLAPQNERTRGLYMVWSGQYQQVLDVSKKEYDRDVPTDIIKWKYARLLAITGDATTAKDIIETVSGEFLRGLNDIGSQIAKMMVFGVVADVEKALSFLDDKLISRACLDPMWGFGLARAYVACKMYDDGLDMLEKALNQGLINYEYMHDHNPLLMPIHSHPRYQDIYKRMKTAFEAFEF